MGHPVVPVTNHFQRGGFSRNRSVEVVVSAVPPAEVCALADRYEQVLADQP